MAKPTPAIELDEAQSIALSALAFLAEDAARLGRFLALTGLGPEELRERAGAPQTLAAVLEHLLGDESLLLVFTTSKSVPPQSVAPAHALLAQGGLGRGVSS
jgi:hypothetical protein